MASTPLTTAAAIGGGILPLTVGTAFMLRPALSGRIFHLDSFTSPTEQAVADSYTLLIGGRELAFGLLFAVIWHRSRSSGSSPEVRAVAREMLGWATLIAGTVPVTDVVAVTFARSAGLVTAPWLSAEGSFTALVPAFVWVGAKLLGWVGGKAKSV
ncbi:hypothetical protein B0A48_01075 [Cryoendolithus antarcticus]|uniref:Uncharacterized protein n=1 Tax=Cryoendolithus antarcticus TaxID=1507870 RepID=A0A1V8TS88_9PEZI|nr:hypothetical protein B0A48_01075 [Cryoendolithus antarcticus]